MASPLGIRFSAAQPLPGIKEAYCLFAQYLQCVQRISVFRPSLGQVTHQLPKPHLPAEVDDFRIHDSLTWTEVDLNPVAKG